MLNCFLLCIFAHIIIISNICSGETIEAEPELGLLDTYKMLWKVVRSVNVLYINRSINHRFKVYESI